MKCDDSVESLVRSARNGDRTAFKALYKRYHQSVFHTTYRLLGDRMRAEDITQEVFVSIYKNLKSFESKSNFHTWCYRITVNACYDSMRKQVFSNLPPSLSMESVYLLDSACCKCLQITLKHDGQQITIFQQPKKHPAEFTGYHIKHTKVDSADCSKVEAKDHTALTFDSGEAKYVVVGKQNDPIMATIMHRLANNQ